MKRYALIPLLVLLAFSAAAAPFRGVINPGAASGSGSGDADDFDDVTCAPLTNAEYARLGCDEGHAAGGLNGNFAQGQNARAYGFYSFASGKDVLATGNFAHAEGDITMALGEASHSEGNDTIASGTVSHAEGGFTHAFGFASHSEGWETRALGHHSHAQGYQTRSEGEYSHAEGYRSRAYGEASHAEGDSVASNGFDHAEGAATIASGFASHTEGSTTRAKGWGSHAEGIGSIASNAASHAEGLSTRALGEASHAEGNQTHALGYISHAEGDRSRALGAVSHAAGERAVASNSNTYVWSDGGGGADKLDNGVGTYNVYAAGGFWVNGIRWFNWGVSNGLAFLDGWKLTQDEAPDSDIFRLWNGVNGAQLHAGAFIGAANSDVNGDPYTLINSPSGLGVGDIILFRSSGADGLFTNFTEAVEEIVNEDVRFFARADIDQFINATTNINFNDVIVDTDTGWDDSLLKYTPSVNPYMATIKVKVSVNGASGFVRLWAQGIPPGPIDTAIFDGATQVYLETPVPILIGSVDPVYVEIELSAADLDTWGSTAPGSVWISIIESNQ